jgi:transcriptional repressor NrdR
MNCPYCRKQVTAVTNSRATKEDSQIWRRRKCLNCNQIFTTHEVVDLLHIVVVKKSGETVMFSRMKLFSGILYASMASEIRNREIHIDSITRLIENEILHLKKKKVTTHEIADITLKHLKKKQTATFMRFLIDCKEINNQNQMKREMEKYN